MQLDDILGNTIDRIQPAARSAGDLIERSAVEATGGAAKVTTKAGGSPALASALLVAAALGVVVAMRVVFRGAIS